MVGAAGRLAVITCSVALAAGCGGSDAVSTEQVERDVASQAREGAKNTKADVKCAREEKSERTFVCSVRVSAEISPAIGSISARTQNVTATASEDGKRVIVDGL